MRIESIWNCIRVLLKTFLFQFNDTYFLWNCDCKSCLMIFFLKFVFQVFFKKNLRDMSWFVMNSRIILFLLLVFEGSGTGMDRFFRPIFSGCQLAGKIGRKNRIIEINRKFRRTDSPKISAEKIGLSVCRNFRHLSLPKKSAERIRISICRKNRPTKELRLKASGSERYCS